MRSRRDAAAVLRRTVGDAVRARPRAVARAAAWSLVEAVPTALFGRAVAEATDAFRTGRTVDAAVWLGILTVAAAAGAFGARRLYPALAAIVEPFRDDLVRRVTDGALRRSMRGRPDMGAVARITHQVEIVRDTFGGLLVVVRGFLFSTGAALLGLFALMPEVALLVAPPLLLGLLLFGAVFGAAAVRQRDLVVGEEDIAERTTALTEGLRDVVACGGEPTVRAGFGAAVEAQAAAGRAVARFAALRAVALAVGGWLPLLLVLAAAPWLTRRGATPGTLIGAVTYVLHGVQPALRTLVHGMGGSGLRLVVTLGRILETSAPAPPVRPKTARPVPDAPAVELRGVSFAYGRGARPVIENLDLVVPRGDHLAVVGPSGIGKSTLAALIAGLVEPAEGEVLVDGLPPGSPDLRVLIPQEAYVFSGSLRDNLTYYAPDTAPERVERAVDAVGLARLVRDLGGYDAEIVPADLAEADRQLIALCRAYLAPQRIVVLDEAAYRLDAAAEARAEEAFARRPGTLIVIAHRISSAARAKRVLVLDGTRAQVGRHADLPAVSPLYRDLIGHWGTGSEPARLLGDPDGLDAVLRPDLAVDAGQMVADGADREEEVLGDLGRRSAP
ncbi:ATP-binding cassette subfamily C protein [Actinomadura pelletieri DSM 43383]|uniref:ATP-binding cassette subfamily C protein n=1 Tax=Actinomadura pelletieri DSM 43383 TaxID=1120940 RepID=A0A495QC30_9ACTN|nr:ABC transporter ATP-binding protein [Actinomadura pelletieri]RKS69054.1 ATP-binding cassette subfamily C protein [Actinomadura pelletieri DSM 43383]